MESGKALRNIRNIIAVCIILICVAIFGVSGYASHEIYSYSIGIDERYMLAIADTDAPTGSLIINSGNPYTKSTSVTLYPSASDTGGSGLNQMRFSNDNSTWSSWVSYSTSGYIWTLIAGSGSRTVYVQYNDNEGNISSSYSDSIILDTTAPTVTITASTSDISTASIVTYTMQFSEIVTGFTTGDITVTNGTKGTFTAVDGDTYTLVVTNSVSCIQTVSIAAGTCTDAAGNGNAAGSKAIKIDRTAPTGSLSINAGSTYTSSTSVRLYASASDTVNGSGVYQMRFRNSDNPTWSSWITYSTSGYAWTLTAGTGSRTVYVQYRDRLYNSSSLYLDSIIVTAAPVVTTGAVTGITLTTATANGNLISLGVPNPTAYGIVWNTTGNPTTGSSNINLGVPSSTGAYIASITGLSTGITYYVKAYATNSAGTFYGAQVTFTTLTAAPNVTRSVTGGISSGKVRAQLSWPAVTGAKGYRMWIFDGKNYRVHDIGNVTSWDSSTAKIYPTAEQLAAWNGTTDPFRWDGTGQSFPASWNQMYVRSNGGYQTYSYYNWIHIASINASGNASGNGPWEAGVTAAVGSLLDTDAPNMPNTPIIASVLFDSVELNVETVTDRYMTANYPGSGIKGYSFMNKTTGAISEITGTNYTFAGLSPNTEYVFKVLAIDNNGNYSGYSLEARIGTLGYSTCDEYGGIREGIDKTFTTATVTVKDIDESGNYSYYGIDIGIFKKPASAQIKWSAIYTQRVPTNNLKIKITKFGDIAKYNRNEVYVLGYRTLYNTTNSASNNKILETGWKKVNNGYFTLINNGNPMTHNQKINYFYNNVHKTVLVSDPNATNISDVNEQTSYNGYNTFINKDDVTYVLGFNLSNTDNVDKLKINLNLNTKKDNGTNVKDLTLKLLPEKIKLINKDTNEECDLSTVSISSTDESKYTENGNSYTITINKSALKGTGYYCLEYTCKLAIKTSINNIGTEVLKNTGLVKLLDSAENVIGIKGNNAGDKYWITTNVFTKPVEYR